MKMRAPENCGGTSLYKIAKDGTVEVHSDHVDVLRSHGFVPVEEISEDVPIEKMTHAQMISYVLGVTHKSIADLNAEELRAQLLSHQPVQTGPLPEEHEASGAALPEVVTADDVDNFSRPQLYGFLKARKVEVASGDAMKTGHLRELAHAALAIDPPPAV